MNCPSCQATVQPTTRFCIACGANLVAAAQTATYPASAPTSPWPSQSTPIMVVPAAKTKGTSLAIEAVAGLFGIFGIGWLHSGNTPIGVLLLIAGFCWDVLAFVVAFLSLGFGVFCLVPIHMLLVLGSVLMLNLVAREAAA